MQRWKFYPEFWVFLWVRKISVIFISYALLTIQLPRYPTLSCEVKRKLPYFYGCYVHSAPLSIDIPLSGLLGITTR